MNEKMTNSLPYLRIAALTLLGFALGYFLVVLLPAIFATWLGQEIEMRHASEIPPACDPEALSPVWELRREWIDALEEDCIHTCGDCGAELQIVRPGKYQCVRCEWWEARPTR